VPYSCRNGTCAACKSKLISGSVTHNNYDTAALSDEELADGLVLLCQAQPTQDCVIEADEIAILTSLNIDRLPCRITALEQLSHDVMQVSLQLPRQTVFNFIPGQYIDILLRDGTRRGFSIAGGSHEQLQLHVRHVPGGRFTTQVFQSMKIRDILKFEGPLGTFFLRKDSDRPIILIAGGTGFAPLKAILEDTFAGEFNRFAHLFWGVRTQADLYMRELVDSWCEKRPDTFAFTPVYSELPDNKFCQGETGWVHDAVMRHYTDMSEFEVYASGPPPMIDAVRRTFGERGLSNDRLYYDSFEFSSDTLYSADTSR